MLLLRSGLPALVSQAVVPFHQTRPELVSSSTSQSIEPESSMPKITVGLASTEAFSGSSATSVAWAAGPAEQAGQGGDGNAGLKLGFHGVSPW